MMYDHKMGFLYINPGAAGYNGFHRYMTIIKFQIDGKDIHDMELMELGERGKAYLIRPLRSPGFRHPSLYPTFVCRNLPSLSSTDII